MTARHFTSAALLVIFAATPAFAQPPKWKRQPTPYSGLFQTPDLKEAARRQKAPATPPPRVVCGMLVMPMDPNIDPKIFIERKPDGTRYTIRSIPPPICK